MELGPSILTMLFVVMVVLAGGAFVLNTISRITAKPSRSVKSRRRAKPQRRSKRELRHVFGDDEEMLEMLHETLEGGRRGRR